MKLSKSDGERVDYNSKSESRLSGAIFSKITQFVELTIKQKHYIERPCKQRFVVIQDSTVGGYTSQLSYLNSTTGYSFGADFLPGRKSASNLHSIH